MKRFSQILHFSVHLGIAILLFSASSRVFSLTDLPRFIEINESQPYIDKYYSSIPPDVFEKGKDAFNGCRQFIPFFELLKQEYRIEAIVETGTYWGDTTNLFALIFERVHTIEIANGNFQFVVKVQRLLHPNVQCYLGSSEQILNGILPGLKNQFLLFYLDAHWNTYWPLLDELEEISKTHKDNCIIIIDDIKVPGRTDILYDSWNNNDCSFEYVENHLKQIFKEYSLHYLIPNKEYRAKLLIIPKIDEVVSTTDS